MCPPDICPSARADRERTQAHPYKSFQIHDAFCNILIANPRPDQIDARAKGFIGLPDDFCRGAVSAPARRRDGKPDPYGNFINDSAIDIENLYLRPIRR